MDRREGDPQGGHEAAPANDGTLSRRAFLRLPAALAVLTAAAGCRGPGLRNERRSIDIVRAADQLTLRFELDNLHIVPRARGPARLARERPSEPARLTVVMPPQHIAEQSLPAVDAGQWPPARSTEREPVRSLVARPTRLVFELPETLRGVDLTVESLLDWSRWSIVWPDGPSDRAVSTASSIEMPGGLVLAPADKAAWRHASRPVTSTGRTELWHTRLQGASGDAFSVRVLSAAPDDGALDDVGGPLKHSDRDALQGKTATARTLIASPYGGWLDVRGQWDDDPGIRRWEQRIAAGRDNHVLVEGPAGYLYPFGHRAARLSVTERQVGNDGRALLRTRHFIIVRQPTVAYAPGDLPLCSLTAETLTTPALHDSDKPAFWVEASDGSPVRFRFEGRDWAGEAIDVVAQAVFVEGAPEGGLASAIGAAERLYEDDVRAAIDLGNQRVCVAPYMRCARSDADGGGCAPCGDKEGGDGGRTPGDTALDLFALRLAARHGTDAGGDDTPPFTCTTAWLDASIPALEPYVDARKNRAQFELEDPDGNVGEVFVSIGDPDAAIPMSLLGRAERTGGIITPAIGIEGVSRTRGAVGQVERIRNGEPVELAEYFLDEATLLGVFSLKALFAGRPTVDSAALPQLVMDVVPDAPEKPDKPPQPDDPDAPPEPVPDPSADEEAADSPAGYTVSLTLKWAFEIPSFDALPVVSLVPTAEPEKAQLELTATIRKHFGGEAAPGGDDASRDAGDSDPGAAGDGEDDDAKDRVEWKVEAAASGITLELKAFDLGGLSIDIEKLSVALGPQHAGKKKPPEPEPADPDADNSDDAEEEDDGLKPEIDFKLGKVRGTGALGFINPLMAALERLPNPLTFGDKPPPLAYPAKLPEATDADIVINVGPISIPDFSWLRFEVSGISARLGIGLYLFPRGDAGRPDPLFTLRIASADKPILLAADPWGGTAYIAANFTPRGLTGFQFSIGIVYREQFDFGVAKAVCSGSIAGVYTYIAAPVRGPGERVEQLAIILKLHGAATVAGFIGVSLSLTAVGVAEAAKWTFRADLTVGLHIAFFTVQTTFSLDYTIEQAGDPGQDTGTLLVGRAGDGARGGLAADATNGAGDASREASWLAYRRAFAAAA